MAKNRLFGKINLKGILLEYEEKSKRIYQNGQGCIWELGWNRDGFVDCEQINMENPFD
jgi:hypothetical protein